MLFAADQRTHNAHTKTPSKNADRTGRERERENEKEEREGERSRCRGERKCGENGIYDHEPSKGPGGLAFGSLNVLHQLYPVYPAIAAMVLCPRHAK